MAVGRKPKSGVKRTPAQVSKMVEQRGAMLGSGTPVEERIETSDELLAIVGDYKAQLEGKL